MDDIFRLRAPIDCLDPFKQVSQTFVLAVKGESRNVLQKNLHCLSGPGNRVQQRSAFGSGRSDKAMAAAVLAVRPTLYRAEEERLVLDDWATHCAAKLVLDAEGRYVLVKIGGCIQMLIVVEPEDGAMQLVCAVLGDNVDERSGGPAIFRCKLVRDQPEFCHDVGIIEWLA
jgi:hypothetical protein